MKITKITCLLLALLLFFALVACTGNPEPPQPPMDESLPEWTVIFYSSICNLYSITDNIQEIVESAPSENVNVVLQIGGGQSDMYFGNEYAIGDAVYAVNETHRFVKTKEGIEHIAYLEDTHQSSVRSIAGCLTFAKEKYPAKKYALILSGHGSGNADNLLPEEPNTIASSAYYDAGLSINGLCQAIDLSGLHFESIVFDTCLMGDLEVAQMLESRTNYLSFSETQTFGAGLDYATIFRFLATQPKMSGRELGETVVTSYLEKCILYYAFEDYTFATIDTAKLPVLTEAFNGLFAKALKDGSHYREVLSALGSATYCNEPNPVRDLLSFCENLLNQKILTQEAQALKEALAEVLVKEGHLEEETTYGGLGIVFPISYKNDVHFVDAYAANTHGLEAYLAFLDTVMPNWEAPLWVYEKIEYPRNVNDADFALKLQTKTDTDGSLTVVLDGGKNRVQTIYETLYTAPDPNASDSLATLFMDKLILSDTWLSSMPLVFPQAIPTLNGQVLYLEFVEQKNGHLIYKANIYVYGEKAISGYIDYDIEANTLGDPYFLLDSGEILHLSDCVGLTARTLWLNSKYSSEVSDAFLIDASTKIEWKNASELGCFVTVSVSDFFGVTQTSEIEPFSIKKARQDQSEGAYSYENTELILPELDSRLLFSVDDLIGELAYSSDGLLLKMPGKEEYSLFSFIFGDYYRFTSPDGINMTLAPGTYKEQDLFDLLFPITNFFLGPIDERFYLYSEYEDGDGQVHLEYRDEFGTVLYVDKETGMTEVFQYPFAWGDFEPGAIFFLESYETRINVGEGYIFNY